MYMNLDKCIRLNLYYLQNSYKKIKNIILLITFSLIMIFTILFSSSTVENTMNRQISHESLFFAIYNDGQSFDDSSLLLNEIQIEILNNKYINKAKIKRISKQRELFVYLDKYNSSLSASYNKIPLTSLYFDSELPIMSASDSFLKDNQLNIGDELLIDNMYYTIVSDHESLMNENDLLLPEKAYYLLEDNIFSNDLRIEIYDKELYHVYSEEILIDINNIIGDHQIRYEKMSIDLSEIILSIVQFVAKFFIILAIIVFLISLFSISSIVSFSALERKEEFIILKTFGLSNKEILKLLVVEIAILIVFSLTAALCISYILVMSVSFLLNAAFTVHYIFTAIASILLFLCAMIAGVLATRNINVQDINSI